MVICVFGAALANGEVPGLVIGALGAALASGAPNGEGCGRLANGEASKALGAEPEEDIGATGAELADGNAVVIAPIGGAVEGDDRGPLGAGIAIAGIAVVIVPACAAAASPGGGETIVAVKPERDTEVDTEVIVAGTPDDTANGSSIAEATEASSNIAPTDPPGGVSPDPGAEMVPEIVAAIGPEIGPAKIGGEVPVDERGNRGICPVIGRPLSSFISSALSCSSKASLNDSLNA